MNITVSDNLRKIKKIIFFSELEKKKITSQSTISKNILVSLGMVNTLLKKAVSKGFVKAKSAPYKRYMYYLTKQGFKEKSNLVREYLEDSLSFFKKAKNSYSNIIKKLKKKNIYIVGEGHLVDICRLSSIEAGVNIKGHLKILKTKTFGLNSKKRFQHNYNNVYLIVETNNPQKIYDLLKKQFPENTIYHPAILHISNFKAM